MIVVISVSVLLSEYRRRDEYHGEVMLIRLLTLAAILFSAYAAGQRALNEEFSGFEFAPFSVVWFGAGDPSLESTIASYLVSKTDLATEQNPMLDATFDERFRFP